MQTARSPLSNDCKAIGRVGVQICAPRAVELAVSPHADQASAIHIDQDTFTAASAIRVAAEEAKSPVSMLLVDDAFELTTTPLSTDTGPIRFKEAATAMRDVMDPRDSQGALRCML